MVQPSERDESLYTYMAMCQNTEPLTLTKAPNETLLVKIGITSDPIRRLLELSGNHIAVIFGLGFELIAKQKWKTQADAERVESFAHDWAHKHSTHASGEYFYMTKAQIEKAQTIVFLGRE